MAKLLKSAVPQKQKQFRPRTLTSASGEFCACGRPSRALPPPPGPAPGATTKELQSRSNRGLRLQGAPVCGFPAPCPSRTHHPNTAPTNLVLTKTRKGSLSEETAALKVSNRVSQKARALWRSDGCRPDAISRRPRCLVSTG